MKESELGIEFIYTINKNMFHEIFMYVHFRKAYFSEKWISQ